MREYTLMTSGLKIAVVMSAGLVLSACSGGTKGPDEFSVLPTKPLEFPTDMTNLPEPTPNGRNLADQRPLEDGIDALGGNGSGQSSTQIRSSETALLQATSRYGVTANIRSIAAAEDEVFRKRNKGKVLERWAGVATYENRYRKERLDAEKELLRLRRLGVRTPTAPPAE